jgi:hypothetical protein
MGCSVVPAAFVAAGVELVANRDGSDGRHEYGTGGGGVDMSVRSGCSTNCFFRTPARVHL